MKKRFTTFALLLVHSFSLHAADLSVEEAWVRATVPQQKATGAFMRLQAARDCRLLAAASPVAGLTEIHEMRLEDEVMKMTPIDGLDLPAGVAVELKPGGHHLMLLDLRQRLQAGEQVALSIVVKCAAEAARTIELSAEVRPLAASVAEPAGHHHH